MLIFQVAFLEAIVSCVPPEYSVLGPPSLNIYICDLIFEFENMTLLVMLTITPCTDSGTMFDTDYVDMHCITSTPTLLQENFGMTRMIK